MNTYINIKSNKIKNHIVEFITKYKYYIIASIITILFGCLMGIFTVSKYSGNVNLDNMVDSTLAKFIKGDSSNWSVFFINLLYNSIFILVIIFFNFKLYLMPISVLILIYKSYIMGFNITGMITMYSIMGTINAFLIIFPFDFICVIIFSCFVSLAVKRNFIINKYGKSNCNYNCNIDYMKVYFYLWCFMTLILLLKAILLPIIKITIIV